MSDDRYYLVDVSVIPLDDLINVRILATEEALRKLVEDVNTPQVVYSAFDNFIEDPPERPNQP